MSDIQNTNSQPKHRKPFALKLAILAVFVEVFAGIAYLGAKFPSFPWGNCIAGAAIFGLFVAVWLWGYSAANKKK